MIERAERAIEEEDARARMGASPAGKMKSEMEALLAWGRLGK